MRPGAKRKASPLRLPSTTVNGPDGCPSDTVRDPNRDREVSVPTDELPRRSSGILLQREAPKQH
jgi:hypothetical protein